MGNEQIDVKPYYAAINAGSQLNSGNAYAGVTVGWHVDAGNTSVNMEAQAGNDMGAKVKVEENIPLFNFRHDNQLSLNVNANARTLYSAKSSSTSIMETVGNTTNYTGVNLNEGYSKAGIGAGLNCTNQKFELGAGVETGYASVTKSNLEKPRQSGMYVTPTAHATWHANKNLSFGINADKFEAGASIKYNF
jgi:hypothetical protein